MDLREIFSDIQNERERQEFQLGKDPHMNAHDWHAVIEDYNCMARRKNLQGESWEAREKFVQVAALTIAAIQRIDAE